MRLYLIVRAEITKSTTKATDSLLQYWSLSVVFIIYGTHDIK